jgi:hypothetical protein
MTTVDVYRPQTDLEPVATYSDPTGGRLVAWASGLSAAHALGVALCSTAFAPVHFKGKPEEAAAAILYGDEVGLTPMQSLQGIYVISGKPALYARAMVALVLAAGHEVWTVSKTDQSVTVAGKRRGSSHTVEETWTLARARKAGYTNNKKYDTDPAAMLYARAASDLCRQIAPDALAGLAYSVEELELEQDAPTVTVTRAPRATTAKRAPAPAPAEPEFDEPAEAAEIVAPDNDGAITEAQLKNMHRQFNELGITDRDERLAYTSSIIGRDVTSANDLTKAEASRLIDAMALALGEIPGEVA